MIDYAQLGLLFKLYSCEVLFNRGLCYIYLQQKEPGMQDLNYAVREKVVEDHNVIDEAIRDEAEVGSANKLRPRALCSTLTRIPGLHCFLDTRRCRLSAKRGQGAKSQDEGLPWKGKTCGCVGPVKCVYGFRWIRNQECACRT
jgi:hypothetical protein